MTDATDSPTTIVGRSRADIFAGLTAKLHQAIREQAFDVAGALFGAPEGARSGLPDAANALILHSLVLSFAARELPGPGAEILEQEMHFLGDPAVGDEVAVTGTVAALRPDNAVEIGVSVECGRGRLAEARFIVRLPAERVTAQAERLPDIVLRRHKHLERLMARSAEAPPLVAAIAWPCDRDSILGVVEAVRHGALHPLLVGPRDMIEGAASAAEAVLDSYEMIEAETPVAAAAAAVRLCRDGRAEAVMKGSLHTDELMTAIVSREGGLRGTRRISHVFAMDVPSYPKPLFITDAAINIAPDLLTKADVIQNAVDMLHALGVAQPKVAILSAVETVNPKIPGTLDAAVLCKMADRGQITGAVLDGPLAFDNAISRAAAAIKKITSPVAGDADILVVPDLEAGNMLAKQLSYLAGADSAGIVLGARVPIILTSRADSVTSRLASVAMAQLLAAARHPARATA